ncbi:hypothetical protein H0G86_003463 [Trichoderma simmonsii]|uniref:Uncharacterized protein n=1 Tax=Trichoderma simmonsii TaxID=1491479 RepID=A0A8G0L5K6_9HYPO|nr:hypothetical protein H0G86_003463 [Trichoderma simmonsii]
MGLRIFLLVTGCDRQIHVQGRYCSGWAGTKPCIISSLSSICLLASSFKFSFCSVDDMDIYESIYGVHMHTPQPFEPSLPFVTETRRQNIVTIRRLLVVRLDWKTPFSVACWTGISAGSERLPLRLLEGLEASPWDVA